VQAILFTPNMNGKFNIRGSSGSYSVRYELLLPSLDEKKNRVLLFIALNGPVNKSQIEKSIKPRIDHPTIHKVVKDLYLAKLIRVSRKENIIIKYYDLTKWGLVTLIARYDQKTPLSFQKLAKKHVDLYPEVLGLWPAIVRAGIEDLAKMKLRSAFREVHDRLTYVRSLDVPKEFTEDLTDAELSVLMFGEDELLDQNLEATTEEFLDPYTLKFENLDRVYHAWIRGIKKEPMLCEATIASIQRTVRRCLDRYGEVLMLLGGRVQIPDSIRTWGFELSSTN
jgi:hypothetical protein